MNGNRLQLRPQVENRATVRPRSWLDQAEECFQAAAHTSEALILKISSSMMKSSLRRLQSARNRKNATL
jgi:hypothetical protein